MHKHRRSARCKKRPDWAAPHPAFLRIEYLVEPLITIGDVPELPNFDLLHFLQQICVLQQKLAHFNERIDDPHADFDSNLAT